MMISLEMNTLLLGKSKCQVIKFKLWWNNPVTNVRLTLWLYDYDSMIHLSLYHIPNTNIPYYSCLLFCKDFLN